VSRIEMKLTAVFTISYFIKFLYKIRSHL